MTISVYPPQNKISYSDTPNLDAANRLRISSPFSEFDYKQITSKHPEVFYEQLTGDGTATFQYNRSSTYLAVGTANGDRVVRQSARYFPYISARPQFPELTGIFAPGKTNLNQYIGYFDDKDGLAMTMQGVNFGVMLRSSVSGSTVSTIILQTNFNLDKLDGTGPSGKTLDITKNQINGIDFRWLSADRIRFYLKIDGILIAVHEILNANIKSSAFMKTPSLPIRYEIVNVGVTASASTLEQICSAVTVEGGAQIPGVQHSRGNGAARRSVTTRQPIFAIRLRSAASFGVPNRKSARYLSFAASATTNDAFIELARVHLPTAITATWNNVGGDSSLEYSTDITAITPTSETIIDTITAVAGLGSSGGQNQSESRFISENHYINQNIDSTNSQVFVLYATSFTGTSNVGGKISWVEFE